MAIRTICKVLQGDDAGGVLTAELAFISAFRARGLSVVAVVIGPGDAAIRYADACDQAVAVSTDVPGLAGGLIHKMSSIALADQVGRRLASTDAEWWRTIDVVAVTRSKLLPVAGRLSRQAGAPALWHMPNVIRGRISRWAHRLLCRRYGITPVGNSAYTLTSLGVRAASDIVYPGVTPCGPARSDTGIRTALGIPPDARVFGVAARLAPEKAHDRVIDAFRSVAIDVADIHLVIAGGPLDGAYGQALLARVRDGGDARVHLLGQVEDMAAFYAAVDVVINGRLGAEPFGISVVEAMQAGVPVLATRLGGPAETIVDGETGWLVPDDSVASYHKGMRAALSNQPAWAVMAARATSHAQTFNVDAQVTRYLDIARRTQVERETIARH